MNSSELHNRLYQSGLKPASWFAEVQWSTFRLYIIVAIIMAVEMILFLHDLIGGAQLKNVRMMFYTAVILLTLHVVNFALHMRNELDPTNTTMRVSDSVVGSLLYIAKQPSTVYTALMFGYTFALYTGSGLYKPFLAGALISTVYIGMHAVYTMKAWLEGGGAGLSPEDIDHIE